MPNEFASTENSGLLKDFYPEDKSPLQEALKRKRRKLLETKLGKEEDEDNG